MTEFVTYLSQDQETVLAATRAQYNASASLRADVSEHEYVWQHAETRDAAIARHVEALEAWEIDPTRTHY